MGGFLKGYLPMTQIPVFWLRDRGPGYHYQGKLSGPGYEWLRLTVPIIRELAEHETRGDMSVGTDWT